ncbi:MAG: hypothetical protein WDN31_20280 [Hyphomicrobium sp.]
MLAEAFEIAQARFLLLAERLLHLRGQRIGNLRVQRTPLLAFHSRPGITADDNGLHRLWLGGGGDDLAHAVGKHVLDRHVDQTLVGKHLGLHAEAAGVALALQSRGDLVLAGGVGCAAAAIIKLNAVSNRHIVCFFIVRFLDTYAERIGALISFSPGVHPDGPRSRGARDSRRPL